MKSLTTKDRETLGKIIDGKLNINTFKAQDFLARPEVAITFEAILNKRNLTDDKLAKRLNAIITRRALKGQTKSGLQTSNITSIDANVINTVRLIWQAKGKFIERHEHKVGPLSNMDDKQLDIFIEQGLEYLKGGGKGKLHGSNDRNSN